MAAKIYSETQIYMDLKTLAVRLLEVSGDVPRLLRYSQLDGTVNEVYAAIELVYDVCCTSQMEQLHYANLLRRKAVVIKSRIAILFEVSKLGAKRFAEIANLAESVSKQSASWYKALYATAAKGQASPQQMNQWKTM